MTNDFLKKNLFSIILPAYNEEENIKNFIYDMDKLNFNKEIIVVDNNSDDKTRDEISQTNAKYILEKKQGYGYAIKTGLNNANGNYLIICEPDGTFDARDTYKLLMYLEDFDCVFGTRTSKSLIGNNAKMGTFLRYGNVIVAKLLGYLFGGPTLTDVGCTFKAFSKESYSKIKNELKVNDSTFQPELMINMIKKELSIVEIPLFYKSRIGYSKITYNFTSSFLLGVKMIILILKLRIKKL